MSAPVKTWASLPASAATDAAMRRASRTLLNDVQEAYRFSAYAWMENWNRDDLARVFAAAGAIRGKAGLWAIALTDPRAALCSLLDLLQIPVPPEVAP